MWLEQPLPESPQMCLLGYKSLIPPGLIKAEFGLAATGYTAAATLILCDWKSPRRPKGTEWLER